VTFLLTLSFIINSFNEDVFLLSQKPVNTEADNTYGPVQNIPAGVFYYF